MRTGIHLVLVVTAALFAISARAQLPGECILIDEASLAHCLKQLLLNARDKVRHESDPLHLPNSNRGGTELRDVVVRGLSAYSVPQLGVTFPQPLQISLSATISWPGIYGDLFVRYKACRRIFRKNRCASVSATPHIRMGHTSGSLTTILSVNVNDAGVLTVVPSNTQVTLNLPRFNIDVNIRSKLGRWVNKILGDPASKIASVLATSFYQDSKQEIEAKARNALDKAIREDVSINLARVGSIPAPTTTTPVATTTTQPPTTAAPSPPTETEGTEPTVAPVYTASIASSDSSDVEGSGVEGSGEATAPTEEDVEEALVAEVDATTIALATTRSTPEILAEETEVVSKVDEAPIPQLVIAVPY